MDADIHALGGAVDHRIDDLDIAPQEIGPIIAALVEQLPGARIAELDQRGLVDLQIAAARLRERAHLPCDRPPPDRTRTYRGPDRHRG